MLSSTGGQPIANGIGIKRSLAMVGVKFTVSAAVRDIKALTDEVIVTGVAFLALS